MNGHELYQLDPDIVAAMENNQVTLPSPIAAILATIVGENDGAEWHWIVRLDDGQYAYITGGCDYTGWDCQSHCDACIEPDIESALRQVGEVHQPELRRQCEAKS